jgi:hypothetical protein
VDAALIGMQKAAEEAFGGPAVIHESGCIVGSGEGYRGELPKSIEGQILHVDILYPELQIMAYLLPGPSTIVSTSGWTRESEAYGQHLSGWCDSDILGLDNELLEQYHGAQLLMQPKAQIDLVVRDSVEGGVQAGMIAVIGGGIPHRGPGLLEVQASRVLCRDSLASREALCGICPDDGRGGASSDGNDGQDQHAPEAVSESS